MTIATRVSGVSFLFCDLVGSTELLAQLGDVANDEVRRDLFEVLRQPLRSFRGVEVKSQGDGLMVVFTGTIDDAIGCAVAMQEGVGRLGGFEDAQPLAIRVGVSAGEATAEDGDWFGATVVEAARLCALAAPAEILVADHALDALLTPSLDASPVGERALKGFPDAVPCSIIPWHVDSQRDLLVPIPAPLDLSGHLPAVGIDSPLDYASRVWRDVSLGASRALLVSGVPRSGRTRFVGELVAYATACRNGAAVLYGACRTEEPHSAFIEALRRFALWASLPLVERLAEVPGLVDLVPAVGIRLRGRGDWVAPDNAHQRNVTDVLAQSLHVIAESAPTILVIDDLQWADYDTFKSFLDLGASSPVGSLLIVGTCRDGNDQTAQTGVLLDKLAGAGIERIELQPLVDADVARLLSTCALATPDVQDLVGLVTGMVGAAAGDVVSGLERIRVSLPSTPDEIRRALSLAVPYKGLVPLGPNDGAVFFGRERLVDLLVERLDTNRFVVVVGASGSGKSSILRAGVVGRMRNDGCEVEVLTPSDSDAIDRFFSGKAPAVGVVIDQFEEVFTLWEEPRRAPFLDAVLDALDYGPIEFVAIGLRSDFFAHAAVHAGFAARLGAATLLVGPLDDDDLRAIIEGPARAGGFTFEAGLTDVVMADIADEAQPLPLLSHCMYEMWRRRREDCLTIADYRAAGGLRASIARSADRVYTTALDRDGQRLARALLLRLVEPGEGTHATRHPLSIAQLEGMFGDRIIPVVDVLVGARLLVADNETVDLAHEALLAEWPRFAEWISEDQDRIHTTAHLARAADDWEKRGRPDADLYRDLRLDAGLALVELGQPLTDLERGFLSASREFRGHEQAAMLRTNKRLRRQLTTAIAALVVALVATSGAVVLQRSASHARTVAETERHDAQITTLAGVAQDVADSRVDLAALLAVEALRLRPDGATLGALGDTLRTQPAVTGVLHPAYLSSESELLARSEDGTMVAFRSDDRLAVVDVESGETTTSIDAPDLTAVAFSPDGSTLAAASNSTVELLDIASNKVTDSYTPEMGIIGVGNLAWGDDTHVVASPPDQTQTSGCCWESAGARLTTIDIASGTIGSTDFVSAVALIAHIPGTHLVAALGPTRLSLIDTQTGEVLSTVTFLDRSRVETLTASNSGKLLALGTGADVYLVDIEGVDNTASRVDELTVTRLGEDPLGAASSADAVFNRTGDRLATIAVDGGIRVYDVVPEKPALVFDQDIGGLGTGAFLSIDDATLYVPQGSDLWAVSLTGSQPLAPRPFGKSEEGPLAVRRDGRATFVSAPSGVTRELDPATGSVLISEHPDLSFPLQFSRDGNLILEVDWFDKGLGVVTGRLEHVAHTSQLTARLIYVDREPSVVVTTDIDGTHLERREFGTLKPVDTPVVLDAVVDPVGALSHDGRLFAQAGHVSDGSQQLVVVDLETGASVVPIHLFDQGEPTITALEFSADNRMLVVGDETARIGGIDLASGRTDPLIFADAAGAINFLAFNAEGTALVALTENGSTQWWDTASRQKTGESQNFQTPYWVSDGDLHYLAVQTDKGVVQWNFDFDTWPGIACERAGRNLSHDEWARYLPTGEPYHTTCPQFPPAIQ